MRGWLVVAVLLVWSGIAAAGDGLEVRSVAIDTSHAQRESRYVVSWVRIDAPLPSDTVRVRLDLLDHTGHTATLTTTPDQLSINPTSDIALATGEVVATVTATDSHGAEHVGTIRTYSAGRHFSCGMGAMGLVFAAMFLAPVLLIVALIALWVRSAHRRRKLAQEWIEVSPLAAEAMVQAIINRILFVIALGTVLCLALYFSDSPIMAFLVAYVPFTRLFHLASARRFLGLLEAGLPARLHDNLLVISDYIVVPRHVIKSVGNLAVPATRVSETRT